MTRPLPPHKIDDGDAALDRKQDDRAEAVSRYTLTQIEAAIEVAEAEYDRELGWDAQRAAEKMLDTDDPAAFKTARELVRSCQQKADERASRLYKAVARWREVRPRP